MPASALDLVGLIEDVIGTQRPLRRLSVQKRRIFALDLAFVALALRCAWLVDIIVVPEAEEAYAGLLQALRQREPIFHGVEHVFEHGSQQSFFVNTSQCRSLLNTVSNVAFMSVDQEPQLVGGQPLSHWMLMCYSQLAEPPPDVLQVLSHLAEHFALPSDLPSTTAIPLAAVLLGYPVAYVPGQSNSLEQVTLDVYALKLRAPGWDSEHTLIKFSCPAALAGIHPARLSPTRIVAELKQRFETRVAALGFTMSLEHSTDILARIAL
ncbi:hypothetical protein FB45DRAFT_735312 [Roridomyces roridus]|uniref:Uncharacterized protein n=1 Tax=Roridomyces roridus TaxID=1738132 RepID=A0AAD7FUL5_9AGAR|nr:hypothetical protein FB45DRAFT_735312 [Roridomyces roridus]